MATVAIVSDIHANLEALEAVLEKVRGLPIYCLGDLVDYGANPNEVVDLVRESRAVVIQGNHDHAAVTGETAMFNPKAAISSKWTTGELTGTNIEYLGGLPNQRMVEFDDAKACFFHGSPDDPLWEYVDPTTHHLLFGHYLNKLDAGVIGLGHTHVPYVAREKEGIVFNPGSVGQPRDGDKRASYAILSVDGKRIEVKNGRVEYDYDKAASKIRKAGLPEFFAERLYSGT